MKNNAGTLYICPTPIGNLKDITLRVIEVLNTVDLILCEDTRVSQKLFNHYDITTKAQSYHKFNEKSKAQEIVELLQSGKNIALVSDAGTPMISDPGQELIALASEHGLKIVPLAGASALTTFMSGVSNPSEHFVFIGFLPKKKSQIQDVLRRFLDTTIVFYESPNRILKTLGEVQNYNSEAMVAIGRELTKMHEEIVQGSVSEVIEYYSQKPPKGEIVGAIISQAKTAQSDSTLDLALDSGLMQNIFKLEKQGYSVNEISKILATIFDLPKKEIYKMCLDLIKN